jgi:hypothetical protein
LEACERWAEEGACACACERVAGARLEQCKVQRVVISVGGAWVWAERGGVVWWVWSEAWVALNVVALTRRGHQILNHVGHARRLVVHLRGGG